MAIIRRREVLAGAGLLATPAWAQAANPRVTITTEKGAIIVEIAADKAPITSANFLRYVDTRRYDDAQIYRASRDEGAPTFGLIEAGLPNHPGRILPPIAHESTTQTGLKHLDGTLSLARFEPGSGRADFFICVGEAPNLDANPAQAGDNLGFAAFGRVTDGMDVVRAILALPTPGKARNPAMVGQILEPPVPILSMKKMA